MFANTVSNKWTETTKLVIPTVELIVFAMGEVTIGIPMSNIDRIVNNFTRSDFQIDPDVEPLDLHYQLFGSSINILTAMVIFKSDRSYCIPIDTTPTLTVIPIDLIRTLPDRFRTNSPLGIASHIAVISDFAIDSAIFIIGKGLAKK
jgi:hypothetical protein